jgi:hypothetical protein
MAEQVEEWKTITDYDMYEVSNLGNVRKTYKNGNVKLLNQHDNGEGRMRVCLYKDKKIKWFQVHRLVAFAFIQQVGGKLEVDHIDRNPLNNNVENLRWADRYIQTRNTNRYRADIEEQDRKLRTAIIKAEKIICECGASISRGGLIQHKKKSTHAKLMRGEPIIKIDLKGDLKCECGSTVKRSGIAKHRKTDKHLKLMEEQNNN